MIAWSNTRWKSDLDALEQSIERAGLALGCSYSTYEEYETAMIRSRHYNHPLGRKFVSQMRVVLGVAAGLCVVALIVLAV